MLGKSSHGSPRAVTHAWCGGVVVRHEVRQLSVVAGIAMALLVSSFLSIGARAETTDAAITDKIVIGTVYDQVGQPISGAQVTVAIWGGSWPSQDFFRTSESAVTDSSGYYEVTINSNYWDPHNTIKVKATYSSTQGTRDVEANGDTYQTVDVRINQSIPELNDTFGLLAMMAGCMVPIVVILTRRRK